MAVKVLLQLRGDATGATTAVDEAETALGGLGTGVDWTSIGSKLAAKAGPAIKQGLVGAALAVGDWLMEGLSEKLATPEGAEAKGSLDELTTELDGIRDKVLTPLLALIPRVVAALMPLLTHVGHLVDFLMPPLIDLLTLVIGAFELVATAITNTLTGIGNVVDALSGAVQTLQKFLQDVAAAIKGAIDGITGFFDGIIEGIAGLLQPIKDAIEPITRLLNDIFGKASQAQNPGAGGSGSWNWQGGTGGSRMVPSSSIVNVYTGADPRAVVRALRRYTGDNGDPGGLIRYVPGRLMPVTVWLRITGGAITEAAGDAVADIDGAYMPSNVTARVHAGVDWTEAGKRAGAAAGRSLGGAMKIGGPMILMMVADWFLDGAIEMLGTEAGKPAADALAKLGDALLTLTAGVVEPMIPLVLRAIRAMLPVMAAIAMMAGGLWDAIVAVLTLGADVLEGATSLGKRIGRGIERIGRAIGGAWALIHNALHRVQIAIDGAVAGVAGGIAGVLTFILESVLGPLEEHLNNISRAWDEWIGRHLPDFGELRTPSGYMWNDVWYEWGTGPLGEAPRSRVVEHPASDAQLVSALGAYARANGGLARALWGPA